MGMSITFSGELCSTMRATGGARSTDKREDIVSVPRISLEFPSVQPQGPKSVLIFVALAARLEAAPLQSKIKSGALQQAIKPRPETRLAERQPCLTTIAARVES